MARIPNVSAIPPHFQPANVGEIWRVPYEARAAEALEWRSLQGIPPAGQDTYRVNLILIDLQNTFCIPGYELFVRGISGHGAVEDNRRLCAFIYKNLPLITKITATLDTHLAIQIFHASFLVNEQGAHPDPYEAITHTQVRSGHWRFNPAIAQSLGIDAESGQRWLVDYTAELEARGKYALTIWPYHAMLGGLGHALVPAVEEAIFFHSVARDSQAEFIIKGQDPFSEHYSALGPEVTRTPDGLASPAKDPRFLEKVAAFDALIIAGQAKSHCVAWTVADLLEEINAAEPALAEKIYLLEDCTSPVVVEGAIDYSDQADAAFARFAEHGMHVVRSTDPVSRWPGFTSPD